MNPYLKPILIWCFAFSVLLGLKSIISWLLYVDVLLWALIPIAFAHALLSTEVARMLYLFAAPFAIIMGLIIEKHPVFLKIKSLI